MTSELRDALHAYSWPGNIRELENVMKRFVVLQDSTLVLRDVQPGDRQTRTPVGRDADRAAFADAVTLIPANPANGDGLSDTRIDANSGDNGGRAPSAAPTNPSLSEAARTAMLRAERDLILPTLRRVHWNRRKAAPLLGISYKTLLNKIKEHGIVQD